ncbi:DNA-directed DNA polymerase [Candidatus Woesearchaeota archaeon]|nr:DNA-directed DNA polymerase [Candidatus Woesearchaeota archaeon]
MKFYPTDINYTVKEGKPIIQLFGRADGKQICLIDDSVLPYFYAKGTASEEELLDLKAENFYVVKVEEKERNINETPAKVYKVHVNLPKGVPKIKEKAYDIGMDCYEYDILFARRYLIDKKIVPFVETEVECEPIDYETKVPAYRIKSIRPGKETYTNPKVLAFDIETYNPEGMRLNPSRNPIVTIAVYGQNTAKVLTWKKFKANNLEVLKDEKEMLRRFQQIIEQEQPDIIVGYFSDGFDFPYIAERATQNKIVLKPGLDGSKLLIGGKSVRDAKITGITHVDIFKFIRRIMSRSLETDVYTLNAVAGELLGANKHDVDLELLADVWDNHPEKMQEYADYNLQDAKLTYDLCIKLLPNLLELVKVIGMPMFDVNRMSFSQLVEWFLIKKSQEYNEMIANRPGRREEQARFNDRIKGAFVYEPSPGLYKNIVVCDYRSLYPSIIASMNISKGTLNCRCCKDAPKMKTERGEFWFCQKKKGLFSQVISEIILLRAGLKKEYKRTKDPLLAARIEALKVLANSFYGYTGFAPARWYCKECAESITGWARHYIHTTIEKAKEAGYEVLYGDTDSVFLLLREHTKEQALEFVRKVNETLPEMMELEFEGLYPAGIFVALKDNETGAKKKYALIDEKQNITIKGFETVRRNWSPIAKEVQRKVLEIVLKENDPVKAKKYVRQIIDDLRTNKIEADKVIISTMLTKKISDYASVGPHVAAAQKMKEKGKEPEPGTIVQYIVTKGKGKIRDKVMLVEDASDYDGEYYVDHQIIPGVEKIFAVLGINVDDLKSETTQAGLSQFGQN